MTGSQNTFLAYTVTTPTLVQAQGPEITENTAKRGLSVARRRDRDTSPGLQPGLF
jgi:hypothetical protein